MGDGSLSQVHVATENSTGETFAIKIFNRQFLRSNHKEADVSMEEHSLRRIHHPGVVKLHACFADEGQSYMVLEYCPGGDLWDLAKDVGCSDSVGRHYLSQVVEAMSYLRDTSIAHRDIKGENVLIGRGGNAKLVDFGSAKDFANPHIKGGGTKSFKKVLEENVGTPNFMAPEVVKNKFSDHRSDTWSLGCTVYQVMSGLPPFGTNLLKVYNRSLKARLPLPPGISEEAADLIKRMVVLDPNGRLGATDVRELKNHAFFRPVPSCGPRFQGASKHAAPVPTLEELCFRVIGRNWAKFAPRIESHAALQDGSSSLRAQARDRLLRYRKAVRRAALRDARRARQAEGLPGRLPGEEQGSSTDTDAEDGGAGAR